MDKNSSSIIGGFTLIEIMIYVGIFAVAAGLLVGILLSTTRFGEQQSASAEVAGQINFTSQTIQRLVRDSSYIDIPVNEVTSTLTLRMADPSTDPTIINLANGSITVQSGLNPSSTITNSRIIVNSLSFRKTTAYPGHDVVSFDITMTYNSQNSQNQVQRNLSSAIARVSAASFDDNLIPSSGGNFNLGTTDSPWQHIYVADSDSGNPGYTFGTDSSIGLFKPAWQESALGFSTDGQERMRINNSGYVGIWTTNPAGLLDVAGKFAVLASGNVGIGTTNPKAPLQVTGDVYISSAGSGIILKSSGGSCYGLKINNDGSIATSTVSPCP